MDGKDNNTTDNKTRKTIYNRFVELYTWVIIAILVILPCLYNTTRYDAEDIFFSYYNQFLLGIFIFLIPILFKLIFGKLPFEYLRSKREKTSEVSVSTEINTDVDVVQSEPIQGNAKCNLFEQYINESKFISERTFTRAGVYLLIGCLIAITGIAIFYSPYFGTSNSTDIYQRILDYIPRFSSLFFVEFIAFFFLKQYRIMMEEYRYYEAIKRKRQDNLCIVELVERHKNDPELLKEIINIIKQDSSERLHDGESTENLEVQKILNQEMDIFSKITDLIKVLKSK